MNNTQGHANRPAKNGYFGTRLGPPYEYYWEDQEPSRTTWLNLAERRGGVGALGGLLSVAVACYLIDGERGMVLGTLFLGILGTAVGGVIGRHWGRTDDAPVPTFARRSAWIEYVDGEFRFVLGHNDKIFLWGMWNDVQQFELVDYWPMFGDAGKCPYNTGWHAIIMTPRTGRPWLISSTIEAIAPVRERFTILDAKFGVEERTKFMRAREQNKIGSPSSVARQVSAIEKQDLASPEVNKGIPQSL